MTALILLSEFRKTEIEVWRPIVYKDILRGAYEVSNLGRVRSYLQGTCANQYGYRGRVYAKQPRILKINTTKDSNEWRQGYGQICLQTSGDERMCRVHLLVATAFLPNPNGDTQVNHRTAVKSDNRLPNLEWSDHDRNHEHATTCGLRQSGEKHWAAKITAETVRAIRAEVANGARQIDVARKFSLKRFAVWQIVHRKTWKSVA